MQHSNNYQLEKNKTIRQLISLALLLLFVVNITPKKTLHLLFGCHPDSITDIHNGKGEQVANKSFHCSCNQADLQTPFEETSIVLITVAPVFHKAKVSNYKSISYSLPSPSSVLRGPPATFL